VTVVTTHFNTGRPNDSLLNCACGVRKYLRQAAQIRLAQAACLLEFAGQFRGPVIICGDLNNPPRGVCYRRITRVYGDAFADAGWGYGYTYRSRLPLLRIDYILTRGPLIASNCFAPGDVASDHRAVVADVLINR
jgi:endonuclease/exonuclease/phosphatase (EEP) superfamily protein YafD